MISANGKTRDCSRWSRKTIGPHVFVWAWVAAIFLLDAPPQAFADGPGQGQAEPAAREPGSVARKIHAMLHPEPVRLPGEGLVIRSDRVSPADGTATGRASALRWLEARGVVVLDADQPGLEMDYYAQGIEKMTRADLVWEKLPRRAESMQMLIDDAIKRSRQTKRPIARLSIIGHAGLPGCAAFGGTLDDCVFKGRLTAYQKQQLVRLRPYLAKDSEIELRQCVTGFGKEGQQLLATIHQLTGARVSSYLADFHFGDSAAHPRIAVDSEGVRLVPADKR